MNLGADAPGVLRFGGTLGNQGSRVRMGQILFRFILGMTALGAALGAGTTLRAQTQIEDHTTPAANLPDAPTPQTPAPQAEQGPKAQLKQTMAQIDAQAENVQKLERFNGEVDQLRAEIDQNQSVINEMANALARRRIELDVQPRVVIITSADELARRMLPGRRTGPFERLDANPHLIDDIVRVVWAGSRRELPVGVSH